MERLKKNQAHTRKLDVSGFDAVHVLLRPELAEHDDYHDGWTAMRPRASLQRRHEIMLTSQDERNLRRLMRAHEPYIDPAMLRQLEAELDRALVLDAQHIPADVVTMNSRLLYEDEDTGDLAETRLVYRQPVSLRKSGVSVLAPVGAALLGLSAGQTITWPLPGRDALRLRVAAVLYQPEAAGVAA